MRPLITLGGSVLAFPRHGLLVLQRMALKEDVKIHAVTR
ncbi:MAG: hypothetical protein OJF51_000138 [Nitrospira sp.]|nr:MAG: hypothetical protein OJF51_000138 [Nitrospira sp.]